MTSPNTCDLITATAPVAIPMRQQAFDSAVVGIFDTAWLISIAARTDWSASSSLAFLRPK
jgi:hypothetical protein